MAGINDDWFGNRAHLHDVRPEYDHENDDRPDPYDIGAQGVPPWKSERPKPGRGSSKSLPVAKAVTWEEAVHAWFRGNPGRKYKDCAEAITLEGRFTVSRSMVSREMRRDHHAARSGRILKSVKKARPVQVVKQTDKVVPQARGSSRARPAKRGGTVRQPVAERAAKPKPKPIRLGEIRTRNDPCGSSTWCPARTADAGVVDRHCPIGSSLLRPRPVGAAGYGTAHE